MHRSPATPSLVQAAIVGLAGTLKRFDIPPYAP